MKLPKPDLYVVYSGEKTVPNEISLSRDFFGEDSPVEIKVKVLNSVDQTVCGQYIGFCRVFDEQRKIHRNHLECARETIKICIERGYLGAYLEQRETEAVTMMSELFDEEYLRKQYDIARFREGRAEGKAEGRAEGILEMAFKMIRSGFASKEEIANLTGLPMEKINELAAAQSI